MNKLTYLWAKLLRFAQGAAIRHSLIDHTSRVHSGSNVIHARIARTRIVDTTAHSITAKLVFFAPLLAGSA